jgi:hypothetical protein
VAGPGRSDAAKAPLPQGGNNKMSFWVYLENDKEAVIVERHAEGGTYVLGGTTEAELNVTYNYSPFFFKHLNAESGLRWLDGKRASDTIEHLENAVAALGTSQDTDYWNATPGNAGYVLGILLEWAKQYPGATWGVH